MSSRGSEQTDLKTHTALDLAHHRDPILDSINEGVFTVDLDWRITSFNRAVETTVVSGYARLFGVTGERRHADQTYRWASWFFGNNKARAMVYDPVSGRGHDGIRPIKDGRRVHYSVNSNAGAESTVESILAIQSAGRVPGVHRRLEQQLQRVLPR